MVDVKIYEATSFSEKCKPDLPNSVSKTLDEQDKASSNKKQKIKIPSEENGTFSLAADEKTLERKEVQNIRSSVEEEDDADDEEDYKEEDDEEVENSNGEDKIVARKGKWIMIDDKGKGKMVEDSEDDDSDDDDDDSSDDSDSDFSDGLDDSDGEVDPLAEVELDNILPFRTRQSGVQPGVRISSVRDQGNDV